MASPLVGELVPAAELGHHGAARPAVAAAAGGSRRALGPRISRPARRAADARAREVRGARLRTLCARPVLGARSRAGAADRRPALRSLLGHGIRRALAPA